MLLVKITEPDGSNPVILEGAKNRVYAKSINSSDEGMKFSIAKNLPKANILNPDEGGYSRFWEVWDTSTNQRLNRGPITNIGEAGTDWTIEGVGRSQLLEDIRGNIQIFTAKINSVIDTVRYENIAAEPRTTTLIHSLEDTADETTVFGPVTIDETYYGLSKQTKDRAIDDDAGRLSNPPKYYFITDSYWAGTSTNDAIIVDLGGIYDIQKIKVFFPWWSGPLRTRTRTYDFDVAYANDTESTITTVQGRDFGPFHEIYDSGPDNTHVTGVGLGSEYSFYLGRLASGTGPDNTTFYVAQDSAGPVDLRYIRVNIADVHSWYGTVWDADISIDIWEQVCDPEYINGDIPGLDREPALTKPINDQYLEAPNACYASLVELGAYKEIIPRDIVKPLALQRIDNNNLQISYEHACDPAETITTPAGYRMFEPGSFFRRATVTYTGAATSYTTFYEKDCADCYPDGFQFAILDHNNTMVYATDSGSGTDIAIRTPIFTKHLLMKGADDAEITSVNAWPAKSDPFSWGGDYSYTTNQGDVAVLHFRGQSLKWYATIPEGETGAEVSIEIRSKPMGGTFGSWSTLEASLFLPSGVSSEVVYEITYESGLLSADTVYEIRITTLDEGFCSIDSFEGFWSASMARIADDSNRLATSKPEKFLPIYDKRFTDGSAIKWNYAHISLAAGFEGDRVIIQSALGRFHGKIKVLLQQKDDFNQWDDPTEHVMIPGGDPITGVLEVDLNTGKRGHEIPGAVIFDSDEYFPDGLEWAFYTVILRIAEEETYDTFDGEFDSDNFVERCHNCNAPKGDPIEINRWVYLDSMNVHERVNLSVDFKNETQLDILKSLTEAIQVEWTINEEGLRVEPRIGVDTDLVLIEGHNTLVDWQITNDVTNVASILLSNGADIDGLPLFTITEDKKNRETLGRTVMRQQDYRNLGDYFQLIGLSRTELKRRRVPEKRIIVSHVAPSLNLNEGDSFILKTKKAGPLRVRIMRKEINESSGRVYNMECIVWPQIV